LAGGSHNSPADITSTRSFVTKEEIDILPPAVKRNRALLYRGVTQRDHFYGSLGPAGLVGCHRHEFGPGIYFTPNAELAEQYTRRGGLLFVVDWGAHGGHLTTRYLNGQDWCDEVRSFCCLTRNNWSRAPSLFTAAEDFMHNENSKSSQRGFTRLAMIVEFFYLAVIPKSTLRNIQMPAPR